MGEKENRLSMEQESPKRGDRAGSTPVSLQSKMILLLSSFTSALSNPRFSFGASL
jgi:hypothetical protein